jgi:NAD(P)-dependent dehydrogenase (short-subunit alcohol dehydrogenase family)
MSEYPPVTVTDKSAVVIGGTSGIGKAIALGFAEEGADVIATSTSESKVAETTAEIAEIGVETAEVTANVRDRESLVTLRDTAFETFGHVDVLINSAGIAAMGSLTDLDEDDWDRDIDVFLTGVFRASQLFAREMESGSIINVSSMSAEQARKERISYCSAKAGVNGFTRAAAADMAPDVRVNAISPGFVRTPATEGAYEPGTEKSEAIARRSPIARAADPEEITGAAIYLASDAASFTTGEILTVDGGFDSSSV